MTCSAERSSFLYDGASPLSWGLSYRNDASCHVDKHSNLVNMPSMTILESPYGKKTQVLKALAHPSRLLMIDALAEGERCVCELQSLVGSDLSTVSKHLTLMEEAGLVASRKAGLYVYYRLRVPTILHIFRYIEAVLAERDRNLPISPSKPIGFKSPATTPGQNPATTRETTAAHGREKL
jgi:DNA-binding transcriptional ArsR family regulator